MWIYIQTVRNQHSAAAYFFRSHMTPFADALIVVPGLSKCQVNTFFRYLFSDRFVQDFECADIAALDAVRAELQIDGLEISRIWSDSRDLLQEAILSNFGDDPQHDPGTLFNAAVIFHNKHLLTWT